MSDAGTQAYVKALDAQIFKDIGTGATAATLVTPVGVPGAILSGVGLTTSLGSAATDSDFLFQAIKNSSQIGATEFFVKVLGHTPAAAARFVALIDLTGGWDSFTNRVKLDLFEIKPIESKDAK
jgi:filamentous hemagglutinin